MSIKDYKITAYEDNVKSLPDYPSDAGYTAAQLKAIFDGRTDKEVKEKHNGLIDEIESKFSEVEEEISQKVDKVPGKGLSENDFTEDYRIMVENADMAAADAGNEIYQHKANRDNPHNVTAEQVGAYTKGEIDVFVSDIGTLMMDVSALQEGKVDKVPGKRLSSNDFTDEWKNKIEEHSVDINEFYQHEMRGDNPHKVTAEQVGAYTKGQIDNFRIQDEMHMEQHVGMRIDESLGDIGAALDELHAYAQALIGGAGE